MSDLYIVVCQDLHVATGPYVDLESALLVAQRLTETGDCVFLPVPLESQGQVMYADNDEHGVRGDSRPRSTRPTNPDHGYL